MQRGIVRGALHNARGAAEVERYGIVIAVNHRGVPQSHWRGGNAWTALAQLLSNSSTKTEGVRLRKRTGDKLRKIAGFVVLAFLLIAERRTALAQLLLPDPNTTIGCWRDLCDAAFLFQSRSDRKNLERNA
jgi:hypothetical protein